MSQLVSSVKRPGTSVETIWIVIILWNALLFHSKCLIYVYGGHLRPFGPVFWKGSFFLRFLITSCGFKLGGWPFGNDRTVFNFSCRLNWGTCIIVILTWRKMHLFLNNHGGKPLFFCMDISINATGRWGHDFLGHFFSGQIMVFNRHLWDGRDVLDDIM